MKKALLASIVLLAIFCILAIFTGNSEFSLYAGSLIIFLILIYFADKKFNFSSLGLWGFFVWLLMHLFGGFGTIQGTRVYDYILIPLVGEPYNLFKYDQLVHIVCYFVMAILVYDILKQVIAKKHVFTLYVVSVLAASGIGGINEIIEFFAVVLFDSQGVGGYHNTAIDICMNFLGACLAMIYVHLRR